MANPEAQPVKPDLPQHHPGWVPPHLRSAESATSPTQPSSGRGAPSQQQLSTSTPPHLRLAQSGTAPTQAGSTGQAQGKATKTEQYTTGAKQSATKPNGGTVFKPGLGSSRWANPEEPMTAKDREVGECALTADNVHPQAPTTTLPAGSRGHIRVSGETVEQAKVAHHHTTKKQAQDWREIKEEASDEAQKADMAPAGVETKLETTASDDIAAALHNLELKKAAIAEVVKSQVRRRGSVGKASDAATIEHTSMGSVVDPVFPPVPENIRGNWAAPVSDLQPVLTSESQDWSSAGRLKAASSLNHLWEKPENVNQLIWKWITNPPAKADFLNDGVAGHHACDVDTMTGHLLKPVEYCEIHPPGDLGSHGNLTSQHRMDEAIADLRWKSYCEQQFLESHRRAAAEAPTPEPSANPDEVQIPCHIRPAERGDIAQIAAIYNQEVEHGYRVIDRQPVGDGFFRRIFNDNVAEQMPFAVAVLGWYDEDEEQSSTRPVIGFAFLTAAIRGIGGGYDTMARPGGKLIVVVDRDYRSKKVGHALIDVMLSSVSQWHSPREGYQLINKQRESTLLPHMENPRLWWYIDVEVAVESHKNRTETKRKPEMRKLLDFFELKFTFLLHSHEDKVFHDAKTDKWYDKVHLRHLCRIPGPRMASYNRR